MLVNNPIFKVDMPDPDVILVDDTYYMVSTTMFFMPGGAILKSKDLVNWEPASYIFDKIEDNDIYELKNGCNAYGKGQWATSLIYHNEMFYACFVCHDLKKTFIYYTENIEESYWQRHMIDDVFHDMSFYFENDTPYLLYGNGTIYAVELKKDLSGVKENGLHKVVLETPREGMNLCCEGCRAYRHGEYIYLSFIDVPNDIVGNGQRRQVVYRAKSLEGPFERKIIMDDDFGLHKRGVAQGPFIYDANNNWYAMLFQDRASVGRVPFLMPLRWENDWPVLGENSKVPASFTSPFDGEQMKDSKFVICDNFNHSENKLNICWQWNHNPIDNAWSFTERPGFLRLKTAQIATNLLDARNTLTQRTCEPGCEFSVFMDVSNMEDGDYAGLTAFMSQYGQIGVTCVDKSNSTYELLYIRRNGNGELIEKREKFSNTKVFLKICFNFENFIDEADFFYSNDGENWVRFGDTLHMQYTLDLFVGYRIGLFNYATKHVGGCVDFKDFTFISR